MDRYRDDPAEYEQTKAWNAAAEQDIEDLMRCHELWLSRKRLQEGKNPQAVGRVADGAAGVTWKPQDGLDYARKSRPAYAAQVLV